MSSITGKGYGLYSLPKVYLNDKMYGKIDFYNKNKNSLKYK